jgi:hypothetical protein
MLHDDQQKYEKKYIENIEKSSFMLVMKTSLRKNKQFSMYLIGEEKKQTKRSKVLEHG